MGESDEACKQKRALSCYCKVLPKLAGSAAVIFRSVPETLAKKIWSRPAVRAQRRTHCLNAPNERPPTRSWRTSSGTRFNNWHTLRKENGQPKSSDITHL